MLALPSSFKSKVDSTSGAILDALPYIDDIQYTESHRQLAMQLIQTECRNYPMTKNYLKNFPEPDYDKFLTPRLKEQHARMMKKEIMNGMDFEKYNLSQPSTISKMGSKRLWQNSIDNCKAQLGNQNLRKLNLEVIEEFGPEANVRFNKLLQQIIDVEESDLNKLRSQLYELNSRRKRTQMDAGETLANLGQKWVELVTKNAKIEIESWELEDEIKRLAKRLKIDTELPNN